MTALIILGPPIVLLLIVLLAIYSNRQRGKHSVSRLNSNRVRVYPQYAILHKDGTVEIKPSQAASQNDPVWRRGMGTTVLRGVDKDEDGNPVPGPQGQWRKDFEQGLFID